MSKTNRPGGIYYCCGSYKRYGPAVCSRHGISYRELEGILLEDLNRAIAAVGDLQKLAQEAIPKVKRRGLRFERERIQGNLNRVYRLKKGVYEDYHEGLVGKADYLRYKEDYERQEEQMLRQLDQLSEAEPEHGRDRPWITALLERGKLTDLDRTTVAEAVKQILVFEDGHIEITYLFSDELKIWGP